jgi:hypothetical protein
LEKLLQAILSFPSIKKIYGIENFYFRLLAPSLLAGVLNLDELYVGFNLSMAQWEFIFAAIAQKENPMKKLMVHGSGWDQCRHSSTLMATAAGNVKELVLTCWSEDQMKDVVRLIGEKEGPLEKLYNCDILNIAPEDLVSFF